MTRHDEAWFARLNRLRADHPDWSVKDCIALLDDLTEEHERDERDDR